MTYFISPRFLDKLAVHITKNFLDLPGVRVPLILGIHGRKGEGKSFQCELVFDRMGIEALHISGGELESPDAGDPARLLRLRYREAAELIKVRGKMCVLMINDLDAGAGRFDTGTQYTVNTQLVNATLMNIADNPTNVQLPGSYDATPLHRVPIIITGNDLSTLYAPLIREGRMEKFFWEPDRADKIGIVSGIFSEDKLPQSDIEKLVDAFLNQAIDFFSAVRSRMYDEQVRQFIHQIGINRVASRVVNSAEGIPTFPKPDFSLSRLLEFGNLMVEEQKRVQDMRLVREYNQNLRFTELQNADAARVTSIDRENIKTVTRNELANEPTQSHGSDRGNGSGSNTLTSNSSSPPRSSGGIGRDRSNGQVDSARLSPEVKEQLQQILNGGYAIGIEYVDERRFRTKSWKSYASIAANGESEAIAALENCLSEHGDDYVRLVGIDPKAKRRVVETIVHRPVRV